MGEKDHSIRMILIVITTLSVTAGLIAAAALKLDAGIITALAGAESILIPATLDALRVKRQYVVERRKSERPPAMSTPPTSSLPPSP